MIQQSYSHHAKKKNQMLLVLARCKFYVLHENEGLIAKARALNPRLFFLNNIEVLQLLSKNLSSLEEVNNGIAIYAYTVAEIII